MIITIVKTSNGIHDCARIEVEELEGAQDHDFELIKKICELVNRYNDELASDA